VKTVYRTVQPSSMHFLFLFSNFFTSGKFPSSIHFVMFRRLLCYPGMVTILDAGLDLLYLRFKYFLKQIFWVKVTPHTV